MFVTLITLFLASFYTFVIALAITFLLIFDIHIEKINTKLKDSLYEKIQKHKDKFVFTYNISRRESVIYNIEEIEVKRSSILKRFVGYFCCYKPNDFIV